MVSGYERTKDFVRIFHRDDDGNYVVWDLDADAPCSTVLGQQALPCERPELDGAHEVNGVACKTAFARLREHAASYTPEWQEAITGVLRQILEAVLGISISDSQIAFAADRYQSKMAVVHGNLY